MSPRRGYALGQPLIAALTLTHNMYTPKCRHTADVAVWIQAVCKPDKA
jgi:hypothetical protein